MSVCAAAVTHYVLEQDFPLEEDPSVPATFVNALISVIGNAPLDEFERALAVQNYGIGRFSTISNSSTAGIWVRTRSPRLLNFSDGLILLSEPSMAAVDMLEKEVNRYWADSVIPLVGFPANKHIVRDICLTLAPYKNAWSPLRIRSTSSRSTSRGADNFVELATAMIEAILIPFTYPGIICADSADMYTLYFEARLNIVALRANTIAELTTKIEAQVGRVEGSTRLFFALYGPHTLKTSEISRALKPLRRLVSEDQVRLTSAIADAKRTDYSLYLVTNE